MHNGQMRLKIQSKKYSFQKQNKSTVNIIEWKDYRQLWLYFMRYFHEITIYAPRLNDSKAKTSRS